MRLFAFVMSCIALSIAGIVNAGNPCLEVLGDGEYCIYTTEYVEKTNATKVINNGVAYMYYCDSKSAPTLRGLFTHIDGESIKMHSASANNKNVSVDNIVARLGYKVVNQHSDSIMQTFYAYSNRGMKYLEYDGQKINLQIAVRSDYIVVGWPVILGEY